MMNAMKTLMIMLMRFRFFFTDRGILGYARPISNHVGDVSPKTERPRIQYLNGPVSTPGYLVIQINRNKGKGIFIK
jgi:hypothetical protein